MQKSLMKLALVFTAANLTACSLNLGNPTNSQTSTTATNQPAGNTPGIENATTGQAGGAIGGAIGRSMSESDQMKLSRALDSSPGKSTHWISESSGTSYTVTPIAKVTVNGNTLCRTYQVTAGSGANQKQVQGTACITADGNWHEV